MLLISIWTFDVTWSLGVMVTFPLPPFQFGFSRLLLPDLIQKRIAARFIPSFGGWRVIDPPGINLEAACRHGKALRSLPASWSAQVQHTIDGVAEFRFIEHARVFNATKSVCLLDRSGFMHRPWWPKRSWTRGWWQYHTGMCLILGEVHLATTREGAYSLPRHWLAESVFDRNQKSPKILVVEYWMNENKHADIYISDWLSVSSMARCQLAIGQWIFGRNLLDIYLILGML